MNNKPTDIKVASNATPNQDDKTKVAEPALTPKTYPNKDHKAEPTKVEPKNDPKAEPKTDPTVKV